MNGPQNFTHKAQEAIIAAQDFAREKNQQQIDACICYTPYFLRKKAWF